MSRSCETSSSYSIACFKFVVVCGVCLIPDPRPSPPSILPLSFVLCPISSHSCLAFFLFGGWAGLLDMPPLSTAHPITWHAHVAASAFFILLIDIDVFIWWSCIPLPISPLLPPSPSSLCILDHFLSFQVSGPVEADYPSPGGAGPPHCLRSVSLSLCSRYAHSPHPVCLGGWGRGAGRPQVCSRGHLLQQQTLTLLLVLVSLTHDITHTWSHTYIHTHRFNMHHSTPQHRQPATCFHTERWSYRNDRQASLSEEGRSKWGGEFRGVQHTHTFRLWTQRAAMARPRPSHGQELKRVGPSF